MHISVKIALDVKLFKKNNLFKGKEVQIAFCNVIFSLWLIFFIAISMIFTTGLLIFHIKIIKVNKTTREELKHFFLTPFLNPFQRNTKENLKNGLIPNISKNSLLDELKKNKIKYLKYIEEVNKEETEREKLNKKLKQKELDISSDDIKNINNENNHKINDIDITIVPEENKNRIDNNIKIQSKGKNKDKNKNDLIEEDKDNNKNNNKIKIKKNRNNYKEYDNNIFDKITSEEKSSSNDILTAPSGRRENDNDVNEKNEFNSPTKNKNLDIKKVNVTDSQVYLPPSSKIKFDKEEINNFNNNERKKALPRRIKK